MHFYHFFYQTDSPQTWVDNFQYCSRVVVSPSNGNVYVATVGGIYRSTDGGTNWTLVLDAGSNGSEVTTDIAVTSAGVLYATVPSDAASSPGIFRSSDNGDNWADIGADASLPGTYGRIVLDISKSNENNLYFFGVIPGGTETQFLKKYTYSSGDGTGGGGTWVDRSSNIPSGFSTQGGYDMFVKIHPTDANTVILGGVELYRSSDDFATNNAVKIGGQNSLNPPLQLYTNHMADQHELVFYPSNGDKVIVGNDGGLTRTDNVRATLTNPKNEPVSWTYLNNGFPSTQPYAINILPTSGDDRLIAGFQDNGCWFVNTDGTEDNWTAEPLSADGSYVAFADGGNTHYFSSQNAGIQRASYSGSTIQGSATDIAPSGISGQLFVNPFELDPSNDKIMYVPAGTEIRRTLDASTVTPSSGWEQLTNVNTGGSTITTLSVSTTNPASTIYYGTADGKVFKMTGANSGQPTQTTITVTGAPSGAYVGCIAIDPTDGNKAMVIYTNYNVKSILYN